MTSKTALAEARDQSLHFLVGLSLSAVSIIGRPYLWVVPVAFVVSYSFGMVREYYQHSRVVWINFDLCFWGVGSVSGVLIALLALP